MPSVDILSASGQKSGSIDLPAHLFEAAVSEPARADIWTARLDTVLLHPILGNLILAAGPLGSATYFGNAGNDTIVSNGGTDTLFGGIGDDMGNGSTAGRDVGAIPAGSRALMSLRVEKGYGSWSREYSPEWWPQESGMAGLIKLEKDFLNKAAYLALKDKAPREVLRVIEVYETPMNADASGGEPIFLPDGTAVGRVTSGTYGYTVGKSLALGYVKNAAPGDEVDVMILGQPHRGVILAEPPFDPAGEKLRA